MPKPFSQLLRNIIAAQEVPLLPLTPAAPARAAVLAEAVQTVQHDVADSLRRDILTLKQECERVEHGGWTAVIFGKLVAQRIFHRGTFFRVAYSYRITI